MMLNMIIRPCLSLLAAAAWQEPPNKQDKKDKEAGKKEKKKRKDVDGGEDPSGKAPLPFRSVRRIKVPAA